ncbi:MAG TPA: DUF2267 domain-containing protein [Candidatus Methylacidiphilales bacterium]
MKTHRHVASFDHSLDQAHEWLNELSGQLGLRDKDEAYNVFRAVLHVVRDRLPAENAVAFAAQLPLLLKGVFFDGWSPSGKPVKMNEEEFLDAIEEQFSEPQDVRRATEAVFRLLAGRLSAGTMEKIAFLLPKRLRNDLVLPSIESTET